MFQNLFSYILPRLYLTFKIIFHSNVLSNFLFFAISFKLPKIFQFFLFRLFFFRLSLIFLSLLLLFIFLCIWIIAFFINFPILSFRFSNLFMKSFEEMSAFERIIFDIFVVNRQRFFIFVEEKVIAFGLSSVYDIFLKLLFIHIHFLVLNVIVFILIFIFF